MWIELGIPRPGTIPVASSSRIWVNTDHIVRAEFLSEGDKLTVTVVSTKPGGSDRTVFQGDDAERLRMALDAERQGNAGPFALTPGWQPYLDYELKVFAEKAVAEAELKAQQEALNKPTTKKGKK